MLLLLCLLLCLLVMLLVVLKHGQLVGNGLGRHIVLYGRRTARSGVLNEVRLVHHPKFLKECNTMRPSVDCR